MTLGTGKECLYIKLCVCVCVFIISINVEITALLVYLLCDTNFRLFFFFFLLLFVLCSSSSTDIFYKLITLYGSQFLDSYLTQIIYNQLITQSKQFSVNGTDYEISSFKVYETAEGATFDMNPKGNIEKTKQ